MTIVGVVNDMKYRGLPNNPTADPDFFVPISERQRGFALISHPARPRVAGARGARSAARRRCHHRHLRRRHAGRIDARETARSRFTGWLMGIFAASALLLAMIGIYGVMSYSVARRTHEIGIRMALGAGRGQVLRMIVGNGMGLIAAGLALGAAAAFPLARLIDNLLYNVKPGDPVGLPRGGRRAGRWSRCSRACCPPPAPPGSPPPPPCATNSGRSRTRVGNTRK